MIIFLAAAGFAEDAVHFRTVDIFVDTGGKPLAAYQVEFRAKRGNVKIVGIEGGADAVFKEPPYYDAKAMQQERVIIAAFSTETEMKLPKEKTRVASIHVQVTGDENPDYAVTLTAAADSNGNKISAEATVCRKERAMKIFKITMQCFQCAGSDSPGHRCGGGSHIGLRHGSRPERRASAFSRERGRSWPGFAERDQTGAKELWIIGRSYTTQIIASGDGTRAGER